MRLLRNWIPTVVVKDNEPLQGRNLNSQLLQRLSHTICSCSILAAYHVSFEFECDSNGEKLSRIRLIRTTDVKIRNLKDPAVSWRLHVYDKLDVLPRNTKCSCLAPCVYFTFQALHHPVCRKDI